MIIASEKKKSNIAEYIIYMWQIEDLIRANQLDIRKIDKTIITKFKQPIQILQEMKIWYSDLIDKMKKEKITESGHLQFTKDIIYELNQLHSSLLNNPKEIKYHEQYKWARSNIDDLKKKIGKTGINDIEACLTGLYALMLMRLKKRPISTETNEAMSTFSNLLALLSVKYNEVRTDV